MKPGYQDDMQRQVARGIIARAVGRGVILEIPCTGGHIAEHTLDRMLPPDAMPRQLAQRGWRLARRKATCPDCVNKEKTTMPEPTAITAPQEREATPDAKRVHRTVMEALMSVYDDDAKRYTGDYTDARVAEETGAALAYVAKVREDYFGPIAEPAEIEGLRAELKGLREGISSINETYNRAIKALETRAGEIEATIAKLAQANGWKR